MPFVTFTVAVLGRVDEKCAEHEQSNVCERPVESTDRKVDQPSVDQAQSSAAALPVQELQHVEVNIELSGQDTTEKLRG